MSTKKPKKPVAVERTVVLDGYYAIHPGNAWFERRDPVGRSQVTLFDLLPISSGQRGRFTVTIKFEPLD